MTTINTSIVNTTLIITGNHHTDSSYEIMKDNIYRSAKALEASSRDLQNRRKEWNHIFKHGSDNQIMKSYFDLN